MNKGVFRTFLLMLALGIVATVDSGFANNVTACRSVYDSSHLSLDGFTIRSGEISLNPSTSEIMWRGKIARVSEAQYILMENLILADGEPVSIDSLGQDAQHAAIEWHQQAKRPGRTDPLDYRFGPNWVVVNIKRLRTLLAEKFDPSFADRIVTFYSRGFAWTSDQMLKDAENYDPNKLTYLMDKKRVFKGSTEIFLSFKAWLVVDRYVNHSFQPLTRESWMGIFKRTYQKEATYNAMTLFISNANKELAEVLGTDEKILQKAGSYGIGGWRMDPKFFQVESPSFKSNAPF